MNFFDELSFSYLEYKINNSYTNRLLKYGHSPQGLFWKNSFTQINRFELIFSALKKYYALDDFIICDVGCGYGKFLEFLENRLYKTSFIYQGCDLNANLINHCKAKYTNKNFQF